MANKNNGSSATFDFGEKKVIDDKIVENFFAEFKKELQENVNSNEPITVEQPVKIEADITTEAPEEIQAKTDEAKEEIKKNVSKSLSSEQKEQILYTIKTQSKIKEINKTTYEDKKKAFNDKVAEGWDKQQPIPNAQLKKRIESLQTEHKKATIYLNETFDSFDQINKLISEYPDLQETDPKLFQKLMEASEKAEKRLIDAYYNAKELDSYIVSITDVITQMKSLGKNIDKNVLAQSNLLFSQVFSQEENFNNSVVRSNPQTQNFMLKELGVGQIVSASSYSKADAYTNKIDALLGSIDINKHELSKLEDIPENADKIKQLTEQNRKQWLEIVQLTGQLRLFLKNSFESYTSQTKRSSVFARITSGNFADTLNYALKTNETVAEALPEEVVTSAKNTSRFNFGGFLPAFGKGDGKDEGLITRLMYLCKYVQEKTSEITQITQKLEGEDREQAIDKVIQTLLIFQEIDEIIEGVAESYKYLPEGELKESLKNFTGKFNITKSDKAFSGVVGSTPSSREQNKKQVLNVAKQYLSTQEGVLPEEIQQRLNANDDSDRKKAYTIALSYVEEERAKLNDMANAADDLSKAANSVIHNGAYNFNQNSFHQELAYNSKYDEEINNKNKNKLLEIGNQLREQIDIFGKSLIIENPEAQQAYIQEYSINLLKLIKIVELLAGHGTQLKKLVNETSVWNGEFKNGTTIDKSMSYTSFNSKNLEGYYRYLVQATGQAPELQQQGQEIIQRAYAESTELKRLQEQNTQLEQENAQLQQKNDQLSSDKKALLEQTKTLEKSAEMRGSKLSDVKEENETLQQNNEQLSQENNSLSQKINEANNKLNELNSTNEELTKKVDELSQKISDNEQGVLDNKSSNEQSDNPPSNPPTPPPPDDNSNGGGYDGEDEDNNRLTIDLNEIKPELQEKVGKILNDYIDNLILDENKSIKSIKVKNSDKGVTGTLTYASKDSENGKTVTKTLEQKFEILQDSTARASKDVEDFAEEIANGTYVLKVLEEQVKYDYKEIEKPKEKTPTTQKPPKPPKQMNSELYQNKLETRQIKLEGLADQLVKLGTISSKEANTTEIEQELQKLVQYLNNNQNANDSKILTQYDAMYNKFMARYVPETVKQQQKKVDEATENKSAIQKRIEELIKTIQKAENVGLLPKTKEKITDNGEIDYISKEQEEIENLKKKVNDPEFNIIDVNNLNEAKQTLKSINEELEKYENNIDDINEKSKLKNQYTNLARQAQTYFDANSNIKNNLELKNRMTSLITQLNNAAMNSSYEYSKEEIDKLTKEFDSIKFDTKNLKLTGKNTIDTFKNKFEDIIVRNIGNFAAGFMGNYFRQMVDNVKEIDRAMTELKKVTDETSKSYNNFLKEAGTRAEALGTTMTDLISSTADFAKLGYSLEDAATLAENAIIYSNVGDLDIQTATNDLVSATKAFGIEAENVTKIVDSFNEVGNNYAVSAQQIGEALQNSASSLVVAGNDIDQSIAMITAMTEITQDAASAGAALKIMSLRIRGAKVELEEMGESTDDVATSTSKLRAEIKAMTNGFDIMKEGSDTEFKSTYEIMAGLAEAIKNMDDISKTALIEKIAGKNRANIYPYVQKCA